MVSPGTPIVSLQTVSPIYAEFQLPQQTLADVKLGQKVMVKVDVFPDASWEGTITTINPEVDPATRNVRMRATVENPDGRLNPGMFANVEVEAGKATDTLVVPATSEIYAPYGDSVFLVEEKKDEPPKGADGKPAEAKAAEAKAPPPAAKKNGEANNGQPELVARQQFVRLGARRGDFVQALSGLNGGETLVSNGAFKLRNGQTVMVNNSSPRPPSSSRARRSLSPEQEHPMSSESSSQSSSAFTDLFIRRPVIAIVVNLIIIIGGLQADPDAERPPVPRSENATITVTTVYVGASADLVRGFITTPWSG